MIWNLQSPELFGWLFQFGGADVSSRIFSCSWIWGSKWTCEDKPWLGDDFSSCYGFVWNFRICSTCAALEPFTSDFACFFAVALSSQHGNLFKSCCNEIYHIQKYLLLPWELAGTSWKLKVTLEVMMSTLETSTEFYHQVWISWVQTVKLVWMVIAEMVQQVVDFKSVPEFAFQSRWNSWVVSQPTVTLRCLCCFLLFCCFSQLITQPSAGFCIWQCHRVLPAFHLLHLGLFSGETHPDGCGMFPVGERQSKASHIKLLGIYGWEKRRIPVISSVVVYSLNKNLQQPHAMMEQQVVVDEV